MSKEQREFPFADIGMYLGGFIFLLIMGMLIGLKLADKVDISWWVVMLPLIIVGGVALIACILFYVFKIKSE